MYVTRWHARLDMQLKKKNHNLLVASDDTKFLTTFS